MRISIGRDSYLTTQRASAITILKIYLPPTQYLPILFWPIPPTASLKLSVLDCTQSPFRRPPISTEFL